MLVVVDVAVKIIKNKKAQKPNDVNPLQISTKNPPKDVSVHIDKLSLK